MTQVTIVAIPEEDDYVWRLSSEKVPHLTMLFLGEVDDADIPQIVQFTEHVCKNSARPFGLSVEHRGTLGDENADVLFFEKDRYDFGRIRPIRDYLLGDTTIHRYFNSTFQYPEWTPHLTMGYPKTPAKKDPRDYPKTSYVWFNKIAVWVDDYEGPTFLLKHPDNQLEEVAAMSDLVDKHLAHYGIKGMRWGIRRDRGGSVEVSTTSRAGQKVTAKGGQNAPAHEDAIRTAASKQKAKVSTTDSLSTKELQELVNRMNLEQQYSKLTQQKGFFDKLDKDKKQVDKLLATGQTAANVYNFVNSPFGKMLRNVVESKIESTTGVKLKRK